MRNVQVSARFRKLCLFFFIYIYKVRKSIQHSINLESVALYRLYWLAASVKHFLILVYFFMRVPSVLHPEEIGEHRFSSLRSDLNDIMFIQIYFSNLRLNDKLKF